MLAPDVEWEVDLGVADFDGVYHGRAAVRRFWLTFMAELEHMRIDVEELVDCGERVFSVTRAVGQGRHSGAVAASPETFQVFTVRDGLIRALPAVRRAGQRPSKPPGCRSSG